jgi:hypothetical protein
VEKYSDRGMSRIRYLVSEIPHSHDTSNGSNEIPISSANISNNFCHALDSRAPSFRAPSVRAVKKDQEEKNNQLEELSLSYSPSQAEEKKEEESVCSETQVKLKKEDYEKFCSEYGSQKIDGLIEEMNDWIISRGISYRDHAAELRNWIRRRGWAKQVQREAFRSGDNSPIPEIQEMRVREDLRIEKNKIIQQNMEWVTALMCNKENYIYLDSFRFVIKSNYCEVPEIPEAKFYHDSPGFKNCIESALEKLKTRDYTTKSPTNLY